MKKKETKLWKSPCKNATTNPTNTQLHSQPVVHKYTVFDGAEITILLVAVKLILADNDFLSLAFGWVSLSLSSRYYILERMAEV